MIRKIATILPLLAAVLHAQSGTGAPVVRGKITFLTAEYVYTSLGRNDGLRDSMNVMVITRGDTIAHLTVAAVSSKSSACTIVSSRKKPAVGDSVLAFVPSAPPPAEAGSPAGSPSPAGQTQAGSSRKPEATPGWLSLKGRIAAQYFTLLFSDRTLDQKMPGVAMNLQGAFTGSPLSFRMSGNFRTLIRDASVIAPGQSPNQTRIYTASLDYSDSVNSISVGRVIPQFSPLLGAVDGAYAAHAFGQFTLGLSGGFEPYTVPGVRFSDQRKFALFAGFQTPDRRTIMTGLSYSRTYFQTSLIREVIGGTAMYMPSDLLYINAQSEVDLRTTLSDQQSMKGKLTSLLANINLNLLRGLSLGVGLSAWRPTYYFPSIRQLSDNMVDLQLRTTPTFNINCSLLQGVYIMNTYSPRSSDLGFGREYMNSSSIHVMNLAGTGISCGGSYTLNTTDLSDGRGYSLTAQRELFRGSTLDVRYETNHFDMLNFRQTSDTRNLAGNLMVQILQSASFILGVEHFSGDTTPFVSVYSELTYRF